MQTGELFEMARAELSEPASCERSEAKAHRAMVVAVGLTADEARDLSSIDESDGAVMTQEQRIGDLSDGRPPGVAVASDREQELVLRRSEPNGDGLFFAPAEELPELGAELKEEFVVGIRRV